MAVEFNEENEFAKSVQQPERKSGGIIEWLISKKIVSNEKGAEKFLITITIVCFALAIYFFLK
jgi:hypothetical protein